MKVRLTMSPRVRAEMYRRGHEPMPRSWLGSNKYAYDLTNIQEAIQRAWAAGYRAGKRHQSTVSGQQK